MRLCELKQKEVINIKTCRCLGCIHDLDLDCCSGCICALIVPGPGKLFGIFGRDWDYYIPWKCIVSIGEDIVLIDIDEDKARKNGVVG